MNENVANFPAGQTEDDEGKTEGKAGDVGGVSGQRLKSFINASKKKKPI